MKRISTILKMMMVAALCLPTVCFAAPAVAGPAYPDTDKGDSFDTVELTNLVIFIRFADDEEITHSFARIDTMFNGRTPGYMSVYNFYDALTYGRLHYNTVYTNDIHDGVIVSYRDIHPRGYYQPYSETNPIGYHGPNPFVGISMREAQLQARAFRYVDSLHLVDESVVLDGNHDGYIDNVSFIIKGDVGEWASLLWPHMEYFPHDSIDHPVVVNGVRPNTFNFEFEGSGEFYFSAHVFRHEMGHSLNLPDHYHYEYYQNVRPAHSWDMMECPYEPNHIAAIFKNKVLHVSDDPIEITADGDYTLRSVGSSPSQNCYYIKSAIDTTQWFVFEYRRQEDLFESGIPGTGLIAARWNDTVPLGYRGMCANAFFDFYNQAHWYWIFRPGSDIDTVDGAILNAHFCQAEDRTSFGPNTDPHPYLTDGTPETSFEITDIRENGTELTFHVHFFDLAIAEGDEAPCTVRVYPNPASDRLMVRSARGNIHGALYNTLGQRMLDVDRSGQYDISALPQGVYILKLDGQQARKVVVSR